MIDYIDIIKQNPNGVLATQSNSSLDTRVVHSLFAEDNKVYFCTKGEKSMYAQLMANPDASFCCYPPNYSPVLTLNGKVSFVDDMAFKTRVMEESGIVKDNYQTADNPAFKLFYLEVEEVKLHTPGVSTTREAIIC